MIVLGIDPGASGALVWLDEAGTGGASRKMPASPTAGVDLGAVLDLLEEHRPDVVVLERAQSFPGMGVAGAFAYGCGYGGLLGLLVALRLPHATVRPDQWHRDLCGRTTRSPGVSRVDARKEAKLRALELVRATAPRLELPRGAAHREAVVDAACVALWGRRHGPWSLARTGSE